MIRVMLVDDDPLVLTGLRLLLAGDASLEVVAEVGDGDAVVATAEDVLPDVILMDVRMPRIDGLSALRALRARPSPQPAVLMLTTFGAEPVVLEALRAGASGFLLKHTAPHDIVAAVHAAAAGDATVSPAVLRQLIDHATATDGAGRHGRPAGRADGARARGRARGRRWGRQSGDRRAPLHVGGQREGPRLERPRQARTGQPRPARDRRTRLPGL